AGDPWLVYCRRGQPRGDTVAGEHLEPGGRGLRRRALGPQVPSRFGLAWWDRARPPRISQSAVSRTTTVPRPSRSWRVISEWPSVTVILATRHPSGSGPRQGTSEADGTYWASGHNGSGSVQA